MGAITSPITARLTAPITGEAGAALAAPVAISNPVIVGTPTEGIPTSFLPAAFTANPAPGIVTQWRLNGVDIGGATSSTYIPVVGDIGGTLTVRQTATNGSGSAQATSAGVVVVAGSGNTWDSGVTWDSGILWS